MEVKVRVYSQSPEIIGEGMGRTYECVANSIEEAIAIADQLANGKAVSTAANTVVDKPKAETTAKKPDAAKTASSPSGAKPQTTDPKAAAPEKQETVDAYPAVKKAITDVATAKGREKTLAMLGRFGVASGKDLKPEQYDEVLTYAAKVLDGSVDPEASEPEPVAEEMA